MAGRGCDSCFTAEAVRKLVEMRLREAEGERMFARWEKMEERSKARVRNRLA